MSSLEITMSNHGERSPRLVWFCDEDIERSSAGASGATSGWSACTLPRAFTNCASSYNCDFWTSLRW